MNYYSVFGGLLRSEFVLPELPVAEPGRAHWTLRIAAAVPTTSPQEWLGRDEIGDSVGVRLFRIPGGFRLQYDDTGSFDVLRNGAEIVWRVAAGASSESAQIDLLGRVFALALHASGAYCLHASAVALAGGAIAFMAPKYHGKSTTAIALVRAGARLITDDTLALAPGPTPLARPGIQTARLWGDSAAAVQIDTALAPESEGKYLVGGLPDEQLLSEWVPLEAVYLLTPAAAGGNDIAVRRRVLAADRSVLSLIGHAKLGSLLGGSELPVLFERAAGLAARVPVYRLEVAREFGRLSEVVAQLFDWHDHSAAQLGAEAGVS